jgi:hypothetical protein
MAQVGMEGVPIALSRSMAYALLAMEAIYRKTCCFGGILMKMAETVSEIGGWS